MRVITFVVPCYNSAQYMDKCIGSLLECGDDIEIVIVDDGSDEDDTAEKADAYAERYPDIVRVIHQENGGHGAAINTGLANARARYFKVVDSDDWLDVEVMGPVMDYLRLQSELRDPTDLVITNFVYDNVAKDSHKVMRYKNIFPRDKEFTWDEANPFGPTRYLLMHSVIYRTDLLLDMGIELPRHCYYVDNIFVYAPLTHVKTMRYFDVDAYRYFIGRADQSVNERVMMSRIDQQLRVTRLMIGSVDVMGIKERHLRHYLESYLSMMVCICTVFLRMRNTDSDEAKREEIWRYLKNADPVLYRRVRANVVNLCTNLPTEVGRYAGLGGYHLVQRIFRFN